MAKKYILPGQYKKLKVECLQYWFLRRKWWWWWWLQQQSSPSTSSRWLLQVSTLCKSNILRFTLLVDHYCAKYQYLSGLVFTWCLYCLDAIWDFPESQKKSECFLLRDSKTLYCSISRSTTNAKNVCGTLHSTTFFLLVWILLVCTHVSIPT